MAFSSRQLTCVCFPVIVENFINNTRITEMATARVSLYCDPLVATDLVIPATSPPWNAFATRWRRLQCSRLLFLLFFLEYVVYWKRLAAETTSAPSALDGYRLEKFTKKFNKVLP